MTSLAAQWRIGDLWLTEYPFSVEFGTDYGTPDASPEVLPSFLSDGDLESTARLGNRTVTLSVLVEGPDLAAISQAVDDLVRECAKPLNTLFCDPGDGMDEPFQFTVFATQPVLVRDDDFEINSLRRFSLVWRALPSVESPTEVTATLTATSVGTVKQRIGTFAVRGSVTPRGSLSVQHTTESLGSVLVYSGSDEYVPANRDYRTSGPTPTVLPGTVSGARDALTPGLVTRYERPLSTLPPGEYAVVVFGMAGVSGSLLRFQMGANVGGNAVSGTAFEGGLVSASHYGDFDFFDLGMVRVPLTDLPAAATIVITITNDAAAADTFTLDETYLLNVSTGRASRFYCRDSAPAAGLSSNLLWIDSPSVDNDGLGRYVRGTQTDRSDAFSALLPVVSGLVGSQPVPAVHEFPAPTTQIFVVASNVTTAPTITYRYNPAGLSSIYTGG